MNEVATEQAGMSKGLKITLIILGVLVVVVLSMWAVCQIYRDDLTQMGINMMVEGTKQQFAEAPVDGLDTTAFNAIADGFLERFNAEELDTAKVGSFAVTIYGIIEDKKIDSAEAITLQQAMIDYYPDLEGLLPEEPMMDYDSTMMDTTMMEVE